MKTIPLIQCDYFLKIFPIATDMNKIIKSFLYEKCDICNNFHNSFFKTNFKNKKICSKCFDEYSYKECGTCNKYYLENDTTFCRLCGVNCLVYCPICFLYDEF